MTKYWKNLIAVTIIHLQIFFANYVYTGEMFMFRLTKCIRLHEKITAKDFRFTLDI